MNRSCSLFAILALLCLSTSTQGAIWAEVGDAPEGIPDRQDTMGVGPLTQITGSLNGPGGDFVDTYSIIVTDPVQFFASTAIHLGGNFRSSAERLLDSRIWMWSESTFADGFNQMLLANDNDFNFGMPDTGATISLPSMFNNVTGGVVNMDATGVTIAANTKYLISVASAPNDPLDAVGNDLANLEEVLPSFDLHGRDLGAGAFASWAHAPTMEVDTYIISLQGATFCTIVPEPTSLGLVVLGGVTLFRARFRKKTARI